MVAPRGAAGMLDERVTSKIDSANRQTRRLTRLIENLLDVSRVATGRLALRSESLDLAGVAADVADYVRLEAANAGCELRLHAPEPVVGVWDRARLEQILSNLLSNAMKYGAGAPIEIAVERLDDFARLTVRDHGIGIAPENLDRIFARFERAASARHYGGLGLGLYITRELVEAHGGRIVVRSQPGDGATFTVLLPARSA